MEEQTLDPFDVPHLRASKSLAALFEALSKAQANMQNAVKDSANPYFKANYADLTSVWEACRVPLTGNGLSIVQFAEHQSYGWVLSTMLAHKSGEYLIGEVPILCDKNEAQKFGAAMTYARRFGLQAIVNVCPEDDDGNFDHKPPAAKQPLPSVAHKSFSKTDKPLMITEGLRHEIAALASECGVHPKDMVELMISNFGIKDSKSLTCDQGEQLKGMLLTIKRNRPIGRDKLVRDMPSDFAPEERLPFEK